jgi:hypothetical protein
MAEHSISDVTAHGAVVASQRVPRRLVTASEDSFKVWESIDPSNCYWRLLDTHFADTSIMATIDITILGHDLLSKFTITG